jgi:hypothetical protein
MERFYPISPQNATEIFAAYRIKKKYGRIFSRHDFAEQNHAGPRKSAALSPFKTF